METASEKQKCGETILPRHVIVHDRTIKDLRFTDGQGVAHG
jgi:hypothetical protein